MDANNEENETASSTQVKISDADIAVHNSIMAFYSKYHRFPKRVEIIEETYYRQIHRKCWSFPFRTDPYPTCYDTKQTTQFLSDIITIPVVLLGDYLSVKSFYMEIVQVQLQDALNMMKYEITHIVEELSNYDLSLIVHEQKERLVSLSSGHGYASRVTGCVFGDQENMMLYLEQRERK